MSKHLADHRNAPTGGRVKAFLSIARDRSETMWRSVWRRPVDRSEDNQRLVQYVRIEKGHQA
ncbi:hypothetical protein [Tabrizicola sp.]|uniref:hypothetical protein n=1 Tax=Tabrizicola sp. TaxID=2005166 RepID=UPI003D2ADDF8